MCSRTGNTRLLDRRTDSGRGPGNVSLNRPEPVSRARVFSASQSSTWSPNSSNMVLTVQPTSSGEKTVPLLVVVGSWACLRLMTPALVVTLAGKFTGEALKVTMMPPLLLGRQDWIDPKAPSAFRRSSGDNRAPSGASARNTRPCPSIAPTVPRCKQRRLDNGFVDLRRLGSKCTLKRTNCT